MEAYGRDPESKENVLIPIVFDHYLSRNLHLTKEKLDNFSEGNQLVATITEDTKYFDYFKKYYDEGILSDLILPYTWNYTNTSFSDNNEREDIKNMNLILGKMMVSYSAFTPGAFELIVDYAYKTGASYPNLLNGVYYNLQIFMPNIEADA